MIIKDKIFGQLNTRLAIMLIVILTALVYANSLKNASNYAGRSESEPIVASLTED